MLGRKTNMNDSEKRRQQLLAQTRNLYSDKKTVPAVHPRFGSAYSELYEEDTQPMPGTFGLRTMLCFLLFTAFVAMDYKGADIASVNSDKIMNAVESQIDVKEVWKNL